MKTRQLFYFLFILFCVNHGFANVSDYYLCRFDKEVRSLKIKHLKSGGCEAVYTKLGIDKSMGQSKTVESCRSVIMNIKKNIEVGGWKCKELTNIQESESKTSL